MKQHTTTDYINALKQTGRNTILLNNHIWSNYTEHKSVMRVPAFILTPPSATEIQEVFKILNPAILSYATAGAENDHNGYLYCTTNAAYDVELLEKNGRRDARRAMRSFNFGFISWEQLEEQGYKAYNDTRSRNNLSDNTTEHFKKFVQQCRSLHVNYCLAATDIETGMLGGYLVMTIVEDWIEVTGAFSDTDHLNNCPNNGLFHHLQDAYLKTGKVKMISYGYSSVQKGSSIDGLHHFKQRIGFDAVPIKRVFLLKPSLRFIFNPVTGVLVSLMLKLFPKNRPLNKIDGIMRLNKS